MDFAQMNFSDDEKYLYHYTSFATFRDFILPTQTFRMSRYAETNDPKEYCEWDFSIGTNEGRDLNDPATLALVEGLSGRMKSRIQVSCFTVDGPLSGVHMNDIHERGFARPRMWAQYGDSHTGVCLRLKRQRLEELMISEFKDSLYFGKVRYANRGIVPDLRLTPYGINIDALSELGEKEYIRRHVYTHHAQLFFEKATDWRDEREFRFVAVAEGDNKLIRIEDALDGVMFGFRCSDAQIRETMKAMRALPSRVFVEQLVWKGPTPWYSWKFKFGAF